jgi:PAS domain S-box-containing protein
MVNEKDTNKTENPAGDRSVFGTRRDLRSVRRELRRQRRAQRPSTRYLFWGLMLILWAVLLFLLQRDLITTNDLWKGFVAGLGAIFIIQSVTYFFTSSYRSHAVGRLIPGIILLFIGLGFLFGLDDWWPVTLAVAGVAVIFISWFLQREIEKRRVTQETLRESEVKYRHIIDNANSVIMEMDAAGKITFINKYALGFFGFQEAEILGHNVLGTIFPPGGMSAADLDTMIKNIVTSPEGYLHSEKETRRKNGDNAWIVWTYKPILDEENNLKEILCIGIDRTQQKKAEKLMAQQIKEKTALEERTRLARDLHDAVSQTLFSTSLIAEVLPKVWERSKEDGLKKLEEVRQLTRGALAEMRTLLFELRPAALADADLNDLLRQLADSVFGRARVLVTLEVNGTCEIPPDVKIALYRIAQEALNNIVKHSGATSARITLRCQPPDIALNIIDNGHGFDITQVAPVSFGLGNMKERANHIGASLQIESKVNEGTEITVSWNYNAREVLP